MKNLLFICILLPSLVTANDDEQTQLNDERNLLLELVPWLSESDSIKLNEVVLISPKQDKANEAILFSEKYVVNIDGADVSVLKIGKGVSSGVGQISLLDIDNDGRPDILEYGFTTNSGVDGSIQDIDIDGEADLKMYFDNSNRIEAWLEGGWRKLKTINGIQFANIDGKWVKVVINNRKYKLE